MTNNFSWIPFYKELADNLEDWENRQNELIEFIEVLRKKNLKVTPLNDKDDQDDRFLLTEIDPFTVFGVFNRGIVEKERIAILSEFKKKFDINSPLPVDFTGIPILNNQRSWFFAYQYKRKKEDIPKLWHVFKLALRKDAKENKDFHKAFDEALQVWGVNTNLTMGLFWMRPEQFLNLDKTNRAYLKIKFPADGISSKFYFNTLNRVTAQTKSLPDLSYKAYLAATSDKPTKEKLPEPDENNYWLVGAYWSGDDQTQRFLDEGIWQNGYEDKLLEEVKSMKSGDKIAIKASATQKNNLPFDNQGKTISKLIIKARGTIITNRQDGQTVEVEWDSDFNTKDWFFYTGRSTIWRLSLTDDYRLIEYSRKLVDYIWNDKQQDYEWFLKQWYDEQTDDTQKKIISRDFYSIDDIINSGVFLEKEEIENIIEAIENKKNIIIQGSPGVGKTFLVRKVAYALIEEKNDDYIEMVQFHQSYCYEDFVRGYRPAAEGSGNFELKDAVFYTFCKKAENDPENKYVFIIDEINRGNISQIFGELLMLIEADKRNRKYAVPLMYSRENEERFFIPPNVFIIGLMNLADRSLALVDYALRRRFAFISLTPKYKNEIYHKWLKDRNMKDELINLIVNRMSALNEEIGKDNLLGPNFWIGHSYFCSNKTDFNQLERSWYENVIKSEIIPLIQEYWFDDSDRVNELRDRLLSP